MRQCFQRLLTSRYFLIELLFKNFSFGNLGFTEQLFEMGEAFWNKFSKNEVGEFWNFSETLYFLYLKLNVSSKY